MNITLSAKESLIKMARRYAQEHGTSLNQLIRDYLASLGSEDADTEAGDYFLQISDRFAGDSKGWQWKREELYDLG